MSLTEYMRKKAKVKLPQCEFCQMVAQYDFVDDQGDWRYGCVTHWMKYRASRQIGPGHARHLTVGQEPPKRPEGYVPKPVDPTRLAKPRIAPALQAYTSKQPAATTTNGEPKPPREKRVRVQEFQDMEPSGADIKEPRPGSVLAITLDLMKTNGGATLEEINAAIGPKHDALKLLIWAHENKGYGWKIDPESKKVSVQYFQKTE
jgi:hypothetical protein